MATITLHATENITDVNGTDLPAGTYDTMTAVGPPGAQSSIDNTDDLVVSTPGQGTITTAGTGVHTVIIKIGGILFQNTYTAA